MSGCPASVMNITVNRVTQGVVFINMRHPGFTSSCQDADSSYTAIDICEVKVMGKCHLKKKLKPDFLNLKKTLNVKNAISFFIYSDIHMLVKFS